MEKPKIPNFTMIDGKLYVRIYYRGADRKWHSKHKRVNSQREGMNMIAKLKTQLGDHGPESFDGDKMLFDELLTQYKLAHPEKPIWYTEPVLQSFKGRRIKSITYGDLVRFKEARAEVKDQRCKRIQPKDRSVATIHREMEALRAVILFAVRHGWLMRNPFVAGPSLIQKSQEERRDRIPTPEEEAAILAACVPPRAHLRGFVIATLDTGLRRSALMALTWGCVDFEKDLLRIPSGNRYKKRPKVLAMTDRLKAELLDLFERSDRNPVTKIFKQVKDFKRSWGTACRLAGVEGLRFNDLRHGYSTALMEAGLPQHFAMKLAGHTNAEIHDIYTNVDERLAKQAADALNRLHSSRRPDQVAEISDFTDQLPN